MTATVEPQSWTMWAGQRVNHGETEPVFCDVGSDPRFVRMYGHAEPVQVTVTEDPDGRYWGWLSNENRDRSGPPIYDDFPAMVYDHEGLFGMCFPYGYKIEVEANAGRVVRLSINAA